MKTVRGPVVSRLMRKEMSCRVQAMCRSVKLFSTTPKGWSDVATSRCVENIVKPKWTLIKKIVVVE